MLIRKKCVLRIVVCLIAAVLLLSGNSDAAMFRVTTNADSGPGSLRQAVLDANKTPGEADEIQIDAGVGGITLASEVNISDSLIIKGGGVTVKGSSTRLFGVTGGSVRFDRVTFTGGKSFSGNGGAVNIDGAAKADFVNCTFFNNDAALKGGAVCVASTQPDATTFLNCTVAGNSAENGGGVAVVRGTASFSGTIVTGNTERGALPQGADIYSDVNGTIANTGSYNIVGYTNVSGSFGSAQGNHTSVSSADVFWGKPLALTVVDKVQVLKLSSRSGNVARDLIPTGSVAFPDVDERGARRPQLMGLDAGAFELSPVPVASTDLKGSPYIQLGTTERYTVAVHPDDATRDVRTYKDGIEWSVSDAGIISVDASGVVSAQRTGSAVLFARVHGWDAAGNMAMSPTISLKIRVGATPLPAPKVTLEALGDHSMTLGATQRILPKVHVTLLDEPAAIPYSLSAFSSSPDVADAVVLPDGKSILLTAKALGKCPITVTASATNGAGPASDSQTFILTVANKNSGKGGGGCDAGIGGLALALVGAFLLRRKV